MRGRVEIAGGVSDLHLCFQDCVRNRVEQDLQDLPDGVPCRQNRLGRLQLACRGALRRRIFPQRVPRVGVESLGTQERDRIVNGQPGAVGGVLELQLPELPTREHRCIVRAAHLHLVYVRDVAFGDCHFRPDDRLSLIVGAELNFQRVRGRRDQRIVDNENGGMTAGPTVYRNQPNKIGVVARGARQQEILCGKAAHKILQRAGHARGAPPLVTAPHFEGPPRGRRSAEVDRKIAGQCAGERQPGGILDELGSDC